ncbi:MAG: deoxyguanosinetriphosphate triphosphohydrolase [Candidatus Geothermincolia bacterium]
MTAKRLSHREQTEERERAWLSPLAQLSVKSLGREREERQDPLRTGYMRDRDRIVHCKSFRRLKHKTQVFLAPEGDHYRTRLTHTLEVSQISRTIARCLRLNEDLTEAIALGHDLGHTPFGHVGEDAMNDLLSRPFFHNEQSLRVVERLEYNGKGLNLTREVRDGILHHTGDGMPFTLEGKIVRTADRIAYVNHDVDDAMRAGILSTRDLPERVGEVLGIQYSKRIDSLVKDMVAESERLGDIALSEEVAAAMDELRDFLFDRVYIGSVAKTEHDKAAHVLKSLFTFYLEHPEKMSGEFQEPGGDVERRVCDYVAGMTDGFALRKFQEFFLPRSWTL